MTLSGHHSVSTVGFFTSAIDLSSGSAEFTDGRHRRLPRGQPLEYRSIKNNLLSGGGEQLVNGVFAFVAPNPVEPALDELSVRRTSSDAVSKREVMPVDEGVRKWNRAGNVTSWIPPSARI